MKLCHMKQTLAHAVQFLSNTEFQKEIALSHFHFVLSCDKKILGLGI